MKKGFFCWMIFGQFFSVLQAAPDMSMSDSGGANPYNNLTSYAYPVSTSDSKTYGNAPTVLGSVGLTGFYNKQCPFYISADERFAAQMEGLKRYAQGQDEKDRNCRSSFDLVELTNLTAAIARYNQLMGLSAQGGGSMGGGSRGGLGSLGGGSSWSKNCFNIDQYFKEEASRFIDLTNRLKTTSSTNSKSDQTSVDFGLEDSLGLGLGGGFPPSSQDFPFDSCKLKSGDDLETCVAEKRVEVVADEKHKCDLDAQYAKDKAEMELQVSAIEKGNTLLQKILKNPHCSASLAPAIMQNVISLGTEVASLSAGSLRGVGISAAGELLNTLVTKFTTPSTASQALKDINEEDHFKDTACLYYSFENEIYNCNSRESKAYTSVVSQCATQATEHSAPLGGVLTDWLKKLENKLGEKKQKTGVLSPDVQKFYDEEQIGDTSPPITYNSVVKAAKEFGGCQLPSENKKSAEISNRVLNAALECLKNSGESASQLSVALADIPPLQEVEQLQSSLVNSNGGDLKLYQKLFGLSNLIPKEMREDYRCPPVEALKGNREGIGSDQLKSEVKEKYQKLLVCLNSLSTIKDTSVSPIDSSKYYAILESEANYKHRYVEPYTQIKAQASPVAASQSIINKFSNLARIIQGDNSFNSYINKMFTDAKREYPSKMISDDRQDPMISVGPIFKACMHMNALSFLDLSKGSSVTTIDSIKQKRQSPFDKCNVFDCLLPTPVLSDKSQTIGTYQEMACKISQSPSSAESLLNSRLKKIKKDKISGKTSTSLDDICLNKKQSSSEESEME